jgi:uncharacterized protein (DUF58 family)
MRQRRGAIAALGIAIALLAGIFVVATTLMRPAPRTEVGIVVFIDSVSLTDVRAFAIRTPDGRTVEFRIGPLENGAQFPPGHLGVHQMDAVPVRVTYRDENGEHVAIRLEDAPATSPS